MKKKGKREPLWQLMGLLFKAHPWHGVPLGEDAPQVVTAYIEIVPSDTVKYELDKATGLLKVDRPQKFSNVCPSHYGLIPQTFCGERVAARLAARSGGREGIVGDGDPLDICVLTEKVIPHGDILLRAKPIGGLSMIDGSEADDKIIAVMEGDAAFGAWQDIGDCPASLIERLRHYFLTYKDVPGEHPARVEITQMYGRDEALAVIDASHEDYLARFADIEGMLTTALRG
ncbi:MAG: inorganic pyrophosphatase [Methylotetracoccus sp.]